MIFVLSTQDVVNSYQEMSKIHYPLQSVRSQFFVKGLVQTCRHSDSLPKVLLNESLRTPARFRSLGPLRVALVARPARQLEAKDIQSCSVALR